MPIILTVMVAMIPIALVAEAFGTGDGLSGFGPAVAKLPVWP